MPFTALGDGADVVGRRAAAAADDVDEAGLGELADERRHVFRALVVEAEFVGQAGIRIGADEACRRRATISARWARISRAPSAQLRPIVKGLAWRTECQKAVGVWPDSVRPDRSVMVPEIITGSRRPISTKTSSMPASAALAFSVSKMVSTRMMSAPPSIRPRAASRIGDRAARRT